jgi:hypothetical protein
VGGSPDLVHVAMTLAVVVIPVILSLVDPVRRPGTGVDDHGGFDR